MNKIELKRYKKKPLNFETPAKWNELTLKQLLYVVKSKMKYDTDAEAWVKDCTLYFMRSHFPPGMRNLNVAELLTCSSHHLFLAKECDLYKQLLPEISASKVLKLYGPSEGLANCVFFEFLKANQYLLKYVKSKETKTELLDKFIATLYRPAKKNYNPYAEDTDGDIRVPFNENTIEARSLHIARLPLVKKKVIQYWFTGCCNTLKNMFPDAFHEGSKQNEFGIHGVIDNLSGSKWGTPEKVEQTSLYKILIGICQAQTKEEE